MFFLNLLLQIQGKLQAVPEKKTQGLVWVYSLFGLGLIGTVSKRLILAGITLMKNLTNN